MLTSYDRTVDAAIYLNEDRSQEPKESFKQIASLLDIENKSGSLLDIGCASGEFLEYLRSLNSEIELVGVEYAPPLVAHANKKFESRSISVLTGDANALPLESDSFDFVTTIGVTSIFDDFRPSYEEMIRVARSGGRCLNHMVVNEESVDVIIRYLKDDHTPEAGWNRFSIRSISQFLQDHPHVARFEFIKHRMPFSLPAGDDPMRSWTKEVNGERILWNGLGAEVALYHIVFDIDKG